MKAKLHLVLSFSIFLTCFSAWGQDYWQYQRTSTSNPQFKSGESTQLFGLDDKAFWQEFEKLNQGKKTLWFPDATGTIKAFSMEERSVMHPDLQAKYPNIRSLVGYSADRKTRIRLTISPGKLALMIRQQGERDAFLEKDGDDYRLYGRGSRAGGKEFLCSTPEQQSTFEASRLVDDQTLRTYRLAVSTTGEYTEYHGGTAAGALAAINTTVSRINEVFSSDLGVQLELIPNNDLLIFTNAASDPYGSSLNAEVQSTLESIVGEAAFDVGHLFHREPDNGNAGGIGTVCTDGIKGAAFSSALVPEGDRFDLDYVSHELGHQFGANHTWSFQSEGTGVQAEPGSGTTIMGYAGITGANDVESAGDEYYHHNSINQIAQYLATTSCAATTALVNQPPTITPMPNYQIPVGTAFVLEGEATDPDGTGSLSYCWEQIDNGVVTNGTFGPNNTQGAAFRSLRPVAEPFRYFPRLSRILSGDLTQTSPATGSAWETVSNVARSYNFALTVRDNDPEGGQVDAEQLSVEVLTEYTPFQVISQADSPTYEGGSVQTLQWDTGGTEVGSISAGAVDVYFSTDGGLSFPILIAEGLVNDGEAQVQMPGNATTQGRIMIRPQNQIFLAVNSSNITINGASAVLKAQELSYTVCQDTDLTIPLTYESFGGFSETMTLSANVPSGINAIFSPSTVSANDTAINLNLTNLNAVAEGNYTITAEANGGGESFSLDIELILVGGIPTAVGLNSPAAGATDQSAGLGLDWATQIGVLNYEWQVATDAGFTNIIEQASTSFNTASPTSLMGGTQYFWRVRAIGVCGTGAYSEVRSFTTIVISCDTASADGLPQNISGGAPSQEEVSINIGQSLPISSMAVQVQINHTFVGDLVLRLRSPQGTTVTLLSNSCGSGQNIDALFTDSGSALNCSGNPVVSGDVMPVGNLSDFNGESSQGIWVLEVQDTATQDGGSIVAVTLEFCVEGNFRPDADGDGVFDDGDDLCLNTPAGQEVDIDGCAVYRYPDNAFQVEVTSEACRTTNDGVITVNRAASIASYTASATLTGNGVNQSLDLTVTDSFTNLSAGTYRLCMNGTDGTNTLEEVCFDVVISEPDPLNVQPQIEAALSQLVLDMSGSDEYEIILNGQSQTTQASSVRLPLKEGVNTVLVKTKKSCQGVFEKTIVIGQDAVVAPNPVGAVGLIYLPQNLGPIRTQLFTLSGQLIGERTLQADAGVLEYPTDELSSGIYLLSLEATNYTKTVKIIKQ